MFRITLDLEGMTWEDLRTFVALNEWRPGTDEVGLDTDPMRDEITGLYEYVPTEDVVRSDG